jgi:hypothetical protein
VPSTDKTLLLKEQPKNGLRISSKAILTCGIWWPMEGIVHYELLERNLTVTAERCCQQLHCLEEAIQQKRPSGSHQVILQHDNAQPHTHCKHEESSLSGTRWEMLPHPLTLRTLPHRITACSTLSPTILQQ